MKHLIKSLKEKSGKFFSIRRFVLFLTFNLLPLTCFTGVVRLFAATPQEINYQGLLKKSNISYTGTSAVEFKIYYQSLGGSPVWTSGAQSVTVTKGNFSYILSGLDSIDWENNTCYLEITVDGTTMTPRE